MLFSIFFAVNIGIGSYFLCFYWYLKKDVTRVKFVTCTRVNNVMNLQIAEVKQISIKNLTYYFYNDMINLKNFKSNLLKFDKKHEKGIDIYYIGYISIKKIDDCENIYSVNPLYLLVNHARGYIEEKMEINT